MSAFHLQEEICDTFDDLNDAEKEVNDNDVVIYNFLLDIMMYMDPTSEAAKHEALTNLRDQYMAMCKQIEDDIIDDVD